MKNRQNSKTRDVTADCPALAEKIKCQSLIMESVNDVIGISSKEEGIIYLTPSFAKETGWNSENIKNKNIFDLAHDEDKPGIAVALKRLEVDNEVSFEWRSKTKTGEYGWVETIVKNSYCAEDKRTYRIFSCRNIQQRKILEEKLLNATVELSHLNKMKDKFFSIIAHDLKNPIFSLITLSEFIQQQVSVLEVDKMSELIGQINDSAKNSLILLENLLEWAKSQSGAIEYAPEKVKLINVVTDCLKLTQSQALNKKITISTEIPARLYVFADYKMISTVIRNILSNAIKYTQDNGKIKVTAEKSKTELRLTIEDNGIGMTKSQIKSLFSIDIRKHVSGIPSQNGSGLGLILCREFMERHNGQITVKSSQGKGSSFTLSFPQVKEKAEE